MKDIIDDVLVVAFRKSRAFGLGNAGTDSVFFNILQIEEHLLFVFAIGIGPESNFAAK